MRLLRPLIGIVVSLVFLVLLLRQVDGGELMDALRHVSPLWIVASLVLFGASVWFRAARWAAIVRPLTPLSQYEATSLLTIGLAANNVLPARTGEIVRAVLLKRRRGISGFAVLATILVERILDGLVLALFLAVTIALAGGTDVLRLFAALVGGVFLLLTSTIVLLAMRPPVGEWLLRFGLRFVPGRLRERVAGFGERFLSGLAPMRTARAWAVVTSLTTASWALEALSCWAVGQAFGLGLDMGIYFAVCGAANLSMAAPSTSGGIGPYEYFAREVLTHFGVGTATATAYALLLHATILLPVAVIGIFFLWRLDLGLGTLTDTDLAGDGDGGADATDPDVIDPEVVAATEGDASRSDERSEVRA